MKIPFGKHKDEDTSEVPIEYLVWFSENITGIAHRAILNEINLELKRRREGTTGTPIMMKLQSPTEDFIINFGPKLRAAFTKSLSIAMADNQNGKEFFFAQFPNGKRVKFRYTLKDD